jgi:hypothetical protein
MDLPLILETHFKKNIEDIFIFLEEMVKNGDLDANLLVFQRTSEGVFCNPVDIKRLPRYKDGLRKIIFGLPAFVHFSVNDEVYKLDRWNYFKTEIIGRQFYTESSFDVLRLERLKDEGLSRKFRERKVTGEDKYFDFSHPRHYTEEEEIAARLTMSYSEESFTKNKVKVIKIETRKIEARGEKDILFEKVIEYAKL